ncbi:hypothetical protein KJ982_03250 [Patescibacteria group bacterium]|nr:hypothetical protein [Patescibacteria group bacterium]
MLLEPVVFIAEYKFVFVIAHVLAVVTGMGAAISADILALRFGFNRILSRFEITTLRFLSRVVTFTLLVIITTGALIFLSNPEGYLASSKFLTKMTVVLVLTGNGWLLHRFVFPRLGDKKILTNKRARGLRRLGFTLGAISITSWASAISLAILPPISMSYTEAVSIYAIFLVCAVCAAFLFEHIVFTRRRARGHK